MNQIRNGRKPRRNGNSKSIVKKFSWQSRQNDSVLLRDTMYANTITTPASGAWSYAFTVNPSALGPRLSTISTFFTKYRIKALRIRYVSSCGSTTAGIIQIGCIDDVDAFTGGTTVQPDQCRINSEQSVWKDTTLFWEPLDKNKWYYTNLTTTGDANPDARLETPLTVCYTGNGGVPASTTLGILYIDYEIVLKGAVPSTLT